MSNTIQTDKIGKLGFGYMRLPRIDGKFDIPQINKMADAFLESGGTYFDAAYVYDGAEVALRDTVVRRHPRESFQIATKLPLGHIKPDFTMEQLFQTSLDRLGTDYVDFYLLHGINSKGNKHAEELGAWDFVLEKKAKGQIRHVGFSFHGYEEDLDEILKLHPETEFVQLQINYLDWDNPKVNARRLHEIAVAHNKPIIVMEPLLGGKLASDSSPAAVVLREANPVDSLASWALRYVASLENVIVTLSGMSNLEQVNDNIAIFKDIKPLRIGEMALVEKGIELIRSVPRIACTECNYCKDCPSNISIPLLISLYNDFLVYKAKANLGGTYSWMTSNRGKACDCTSCGVCEAACPQGLEIIDTISKVSELFD